MCCKCPPLPIPTGNILATYLLITITFGVYIKLSESVYVVGPAQIQINTIDRCPQDTLPSGIDMQLKFDEQGKSVSGNVTLNSDFDAKVKINLREISNHPTITYLNQKGFCKLADDFLDDHAYQKLFSDEDAEIESICPISKGDYVINELRTDFAVWRIHTEMLGYKKYQLELVREGQLLLCLKLGIKVTLKSLTEYDEYRNLYKE
ncbi:uncharacterized protein LOC114324243 [Diabrotica virgifera virgifera]|uniref:Uncharacterized protein LOC114324243 n=1 Tax=Diabrotica virgifera virgifera TaxID=50390 RepID=A0A6P7F2U3_DIAVI|nr:uncharacterized protein LOC114324243 [Diabrotica virgifera virgifera]